MSAAETQRQLDACKTFTLREFVRSCKLPDEVRIVKGFKGQSDEDSVANGETLRILSVRQEGHVKAEGHAGGLIQVPIDCPAFFVDLGLPVDQPTVWEHLLLSDPTVRKPISLARLVEKPLPLVAALYQDYQDGTLALRDMIILRSVAKEELVVACPCSVDVPKEEDLLALPIQVDVEVILLSELERNQRYASLWPEAEAAVNAMVITRRLGIASDPGQQQRMDRKISRRDKGKDKRATAGAAEHVASPTPPDPPRRNTTASSSSRPPVLPRHAPKAGPDGYLVPALVVPAGAPADPQYIARADMTREPPRLYTLPRMEKGDEPPPVPRRAHSVGSATSPTAAAAPTPLSPPAGRPEERGRAMTSSADVTAASVARRFSTKMVGAITVFDVCCMLNELRMGHYCPAFEREQIDGSLLLMLNPEMLQRDLGVSSKLHQLKINQLIGILKANNT